MAWAGLFFVLEQNRFASTFGHESLACGARKGKGSLFAISIVDSDWNALCFGEDCK
jgi:hypothetical protein